MRPRVIPTTCLLAGGLSFSESHSFFSRSAGAAGQLAQIPAAADASIRWPLLPEMNG
jgi:hypothetical protein